MQFRDLTTAIVVALVAIIAASGASLAGSFVLCVGADGHADLEIALGGCCVDEDPVRADTAGDHPTASNDPCADCADLDLNSTPLVKEKHRLQPPHLGAISTPVGHVAWILWSADSDPSGGTVPPHLASLETVVLLT